MIPYKILDEVNYKVNIILSFKTDLAEHGKKDFWQPPQMTTALKTGDCEDYAILKMYHLKQAGYSAKDMRVGYFIDEYGLGHAMLICKSQCSGGFMWRKTVDCEYLLDNRTHAMYKLGQTKDIYKNDLDVSRLVK
jgi:predicted transglutaminase-like cysteine proteinase